MPIRPIIHDQTANRATSKTGKPWSRGDMVMNQVLDIIDMKEAKINELTNQNRILESQIKEASMKTFKEDKHD